ncbi:MARVEL domain-containing protein 3 [Protopterus annectens]|uniref:MARVEL domain-containing protein 3 n=1 Tax=Protopterus annectens TaxID=7888 RepID=UPI001CF9485C|nr:MARVEL domain-containing protein 3 [Protopterus annectens]
MREDPRYRDGDRRSRPRKELDAHSQEHRKEHHKNSFKNQPYPDQKREIYREDAGKEHRHKDTTRGQERRHRLDDPVRKNNTATENQKRNKPRSDKNYQPEEYTDNSYKMRPEHHPTSYIEKSDIDSRPSRSSMEDLSKSRVYSNQPAYHRYAYDETPTETYVQTNQRPSSVEREYYEPEPLRGILECNRCRYLCTGRAMCQMVEVLLNMLILVCASVSYNTTEGYTGITNLGGIYYYQFGGAYSGFSGADGQKAQELDRAFYQLKLPTVSATMAFGGALMGFACLMVLLGVLGVPWYFPPSLIIECVFDVVIALGYIPAIAFYFIYLLDAYSSQTCKDRETLYSSKGYQGFSCALHGADIAAGLMGCVAVLVYILGAILAILAFRKLQKLKKRPNIQEYEF